MRVGRFFPKRGFFHYGEWREDILGLIDPEVVPVGSIIPHENPLGIVVQKDFVYRPDFYRERNSIQGRLKSRHERAGLEWVLTLVRFDVIHLDLLGWRVADPKFSAHVAGWQLPLNTPF